ncbi:hypothetical protein FD755_020497 [Muntiacus reevesi]|uniref:Uncharacterized protein n=1 Tax=Muntiacus reevesi TaxID=9886 RepID=A0A5N3X0M1_MUNRE|nr:hypothetical protein FD755_020497 [Muntiacus reevesi]
MDLPVDEWKSYTLQKWSLLPKSIQVTISTAKTLNDLFLHSSLLLHLCPEISEAHLTCALHQDRLLQ